jgi:hypothetical protein
MLIVSDALSYNAMQILKDSLQERGVRWDSVKFESADNFSPFQARGEKVVLALGMRAARVCTRDLTDGVDIFNLRGFVFQGSFGGVCVVSVNPEDVVSMWVPWRMLLSCDIQRAKDIEEKGFERPERKVEIVT